ncbi:transposase [Kitasatospora sp. GP30]|nr:hypothetical protein [Kitasatospora sp. GP30]MDH6138589.1 transposase [Kitasatospora sp. GP30]
MITSWQARHPSVTGHQGNFDMREIVNALLYQCRTGDRRTRRSASPPRKPIAGDPRRLSD